MIERHFAKLRARSEISAAEETAIRDAVSEYRDYPADRVVIKRHVELDHSTLLLDGIMCRYKDLRNGERQITELHVAGDFADLHSFTLKYLDHSVMTLTPAHVAIVPHDALKSITEEFPRLTRIFWFSTNVDAAVHREWELSLGRRMAVARVAMLLCEMQIRLEIVGLGNENTFDLPLTQTDIAECTGLTNVSVNRTLRQLREQELVTVQGRTVTLLDKAGLWRLAEFDPTYLYLNKRDR
jgi:CRP-like cAMP-binding protein